MSVKRPCVLVQRPCTVRAILGRSVHSPCILLGVRARPCISVHIRARPCTSVHDPCSFVDVRADFVGSVHVRACPCMFIQVPDRSNWYLYMSV